MTVKDTTAMIAGMTPARRPGQWVYCCTTDAHILAAATPHAFALIHEAEGTTLILPLAAATALGFDTTLAMALITLNVFSDLEGIGLTAAVADALTQARIPCNVVAGFHHDHVFVPEGDADRAMTALIALQRGAAE